MDIDVITVKKRMLDAILTTMDNAVLPWVEMAVRSITGSSRRKPCSTFQNHDRRDFTTNAENTPLMSASNGIDLNIDQDRNDETGFVGNFENGDFSVLRPI